MTSEFYKAFNQGKQSNNNINEKYYIAKDTSRRGMSYISSYKNLIFEYCEEMINAKKFNLDEIVDIYLHLKDRVEIFEVNVDYKPVKINITLS